ncbi:ChuX/HutX family heme-like substrate-binding protein, partial [Shewanella sp. 0m-11]
ISAIALISKPFRGTESHSINFFGAQGEVVFKVYLGRDKKRVLLPDQVARFIELKHSVNSVTA